MQVLIIKYGPMLLGAIMTIVNSKWGKEQTEKVTVAAQDVASDWIDQKIERSKSQELADYYSWLNEERRRNRGKFELFPEWSVQTRVLRAIFD